MQAKAPAKLPMRAGFTLIEMAIVLVIIGLIAGAVVVGQDLMRAAGVRATISQIEKYNTAVNTFREKYGYLPGDINASAAAQFGFLPRGIYHGMGDGDGYIEGLYANSPSTNTGYAIGYGETAMVWVDLSMANLIDGGFNTSTMLSRPPGTITGAGLSAYFPTAKLGGGNYIYIWSDGVFHSGGNGWVGWSNNGTNYFGLSTISQIDGTGQSTSTATLPVKDAFAIDSKIDDGLPQLGRVTVQYVSLGLLAWAGTAYTGAPTTAATAGSATSCYDNSSAASGTPGVAGAAQHYSLEISGGSGPNCALSFRFQ